MFEDSMIESAGSVSSNSRWLVLGSVALQGLAVAVVLVFPIFYPDALPRLTTPNMLVAPPQSQAPRVPRPAQVAPALAHTTVLLLDLSNVHARISTMQHLAFLNTETGPPAALESVIGQFANGITDGMPNIMTSTPAPVARAMPKGPVRVSSGVAAGQLLTPIRPIYPRTAIVARVEGTVTVGATISRRGTIENAHIVSGPAMLQGAALQAIRTASYKPFVLDGRPVEVETTINLVFTLGR